MSMQNCVGETTGRRVTSRRRCLASVIDCDTSVGTNRPTNLSRWHCPVIAVSSINILRAHVAVEPPPLQLMAYRLPWWHPAKSGAPSGSYAHSCHEGEVSLNHHGDTPYEACIHGDIDMGIFTCHVNIKSDGVGP